MRLDYVRSAPRAIAVLCSLPLLATGGFRDLRGAQETWGFGTFEPVSVPVDLLTTSDLAFGSVVLLSLVQLESSERFDEWTSRELTSGFGHANTWPRWVGRELGSSKGTLAVAGAPLVYGLLAADARARGLGVESLTSLYAASFLTRVLKIGVGRARPGRSADADAFAPFTGEASLHSFPSGHATRVFALAATLSRELGDDAPWFPYVAYTVATWSAATRVMDSAHWLTDITAGAAIGIFASGFVDRLNRSARAGGLALDVRSMPDGAAALGVIVPLR